MSNHTVEDRITFLENEIRFLGNQGSNNTSRSLALESQVASIEGRLSYAMNVIRFLQNQITFLHRQTIVKKSTENPGE